MAIGARPLITEEHIRARPLVIVLSSEDFEYALASHDPAYRETAPADFLVGHWGYRSLRELKSDAKIWDKCHSGGRSHQIAIRHLANRPVLLANKLRFEESALKLVLSEVTFNPDHRAKSSNLRDLFSALGAEPA